MNSIEKNQDIEELSILEKLLDVILQKIVLIIIVVVLALVAGYVYDKTRVHTYTITDNVSCSAINTAERDNHAAHVNATRRYLSTVNDFFKTGVVVDRANFYYAQYLAMLNERYPDYATRESKRTKFLDEYIFTVNGEKFFVKEDIDDIGIYVGSSFDITLKNGEKLHRYKLSELKSNEIIFTFDGETKSVNRGDIDYLIFTPYETEYEVLKLKDIKYNISASRISVLSAAEDSFNFYVSYKDIDASVAREKTRIIVLAANQEAKVLADDYIEEEGKPVSFKYFNIVEISFKDLGLKSTIKDMSTRKTMFFFGLAGIFLGCIIVYIISLLDATITTKKDIERITGVPLFTYIEEIKEENKKNG